MPAELANRDIMLQKKKKNRNSSTNSYSNPTILREIAFRTDILIGEIQYLNGIYKASW